MIKGHYAGPCVHWAGAQPPRPRGPVLWASEARAVCGGGVVLGRARARVIKTATTACSALAMRLGEKTGEYCPAFWILKKSYKVSWFEMVATNTYFFFKCYMEKKKTFFCPISGVLVCSPFPRAYRKNKLFSSLVPKSSYRPRSLWVYVKNADIRTPNRD